MSRFEPIVPRWSAISRLLPKLVPARPAHARRRLGLTLERLEDRSVISRINLPVTSLADTGPGTLRSAITEADAGAGATQTYNIEFKVSGTITLESALPDLSKSVNLRGPGAHRLTVERGRSAPSCSIFVVDSGATVKITGMTIADGGAIYNATTGTVTIGHTTISGNSATTGGGLYNSGGGQAVIDYSTLNDSTGGGLVNNGSGPGNSGSNVRLKKTVVDGVLSSEIYDI